MYKLLFSAEDIEIEQLDILTEEDLKLLIPHIGPRRKFQNKLKKYLCEVYLFLVRSIYFFLCNYIK